jgi:hypothetical protein
VLTRQSIYLLFGQLMDQEARNFVTSKDEVGFGRAQADDRSMAAILGPPPRENRCAKHRQRERCEGSEGSRQTQIVLALVVPLIFGAIVGVVLGASATVY